MSPAVALTTGAAGFFKSATVDGVNISFDVKYSYNASIQEKDLGMGENILDFVESKGSEYDRSHVEGSVIEEGERVTAFSGYKGKIKAGTDNRGIFHETFHLMGLSDRYWETDGNMGHGTTTMEGYEGDIMSKGNNISLNHYRAYLHHIKSDPGLKIYQHLSKFFGTNGDRFNESRVVDIDSRGFLLFQTNAKQTNPYEYSYTAQGTRKAGY